MFDDDKNIAIKIKILTRFKKTSLKRRRIMTVLKLCPAGRLSLDRDTFSASSGITKYTVSLGGKDVKVIPCGLCW